LVLLLHLVSGHYALQVKQLVLTSGFQQLELVMGSHVSPFGFTGVATDDDSTAWLTSGAGCCGVCCLD
jgi:hypothetical protein